MVVVGSLMSIWMSWTATGGKCEREAVTILSCSGTTLRKPRILMSFHMFSLNFTFFIYGNAYWVEKIVFQAANIITLYDVSNIWHIPLLLKVSNMLQNLVVKECGKELFILLFFSFFFFCWKVLHWRLYSKYIYSLSMHLLSFHRIRRHMKQF